ncbi:glycosyltransferase [Lyngbya sp. CCAP 1446/10]|uniref:glycosyltransferase n=1 Tax=Lyngbya sp. CCAP 1446/10 TaxID=439293 RepID=UPI00223741AF|nr:methyltransferase domain-containing protein [Lyngbya sp. CCAP 1446/10]
MTPKLGAMPVQCKICESDSRHFAIAKIINKYDIDYFQCSNCGFVQTEEPYWLDEAYSQAIASSDVGLVYRNLSFSHFTKILLFNFFNHQENFLDYGGGYGLFVRLMRDAGFDFYWFDKFCQNLFAQGFEIDETENNPFELVTAFEVFEHLVHPICELEDILKKSRNILFSTELLPESNPKPDEWWYYVLHEGQHIAIYTAKSLAIIAAKFNLNLYSNGSSLHLLTEKELPDNVFEQLAKGELAAVNKVSLLQNDYLKAVQKFTTSQHSENINPRQIENDSDEPNPVNIIVDGVFFQLYRTGIARVWQSLLEEWGKNGFGKHIIVLDRAGTSPKIAGIRYLNIPPYDYETRETDREMLQQVCDQEGADIFISTYYTTPLSTPSVFMAYDMIPEVLRANLDEPMWREKHHAIRHASAYISISENTARDLTKFFPDIPLESITVAHCGVENLFAPASQEKINSFKIKYGISKPYFISVGSGSDYKNIILFFQAFGKLASQQGFEIVCTGTGILLEGDLRNYTLGSVVHKLHLSDDELRLAYAGAVALIYPSKYEGFGMPVLEAMSCGCPVITCPNASIPEVAGEAALYVNDEDVEGLADALCEVQKPKIRNSLIAAGLQRAQKFSWSKMAQTMSAALINATLLPFNLRDINLIVFPDWSQPEESLGLELEGVVRAIATHADKSNITLLVDTTNISDEDANLALSSVVMNLLMEEDLDVSDGLEISLIGQLSKIQWSALIPRLHSRIVLENENTEAIAQAKADRLSSFELDRFMQESN